MADFKHSAADVYVGSDGDVTRAFYAELEQRGPLGKVALNLFRAQKCSARAKMYRRRAHKGEAYDRKNWSMGLLCEELALYGGSKRCADPLINYGWKQDPSTPGFEWVLYVDLPQGQVSFHSATRGAGPDYPGEWCGEHLSAERIVAFCDHCMEPRQALSATPGKPLTADECGSRGSERIKPNRKAEALASQAALFTDASRSEPS
jgi:hypothetical protein